MNFSVESNKTLKASLDDDAIAILEDADTILMYITDALEDKDFTNITCLNPFEKPVKYSLEEIIKVRDFLQDLQSVYEITE